MTGNRYVPAALLLIGVVVWLLGAAVFTGVFATLLTTIGYAFMVGGAVGLAVLNRP